jgi:type VI secretion system ImpM family protein
MTALPVGCHGKLPFHGDFIRLHGSPSPADAIDRWFVSGARTMADTAAFDRSGPVFAIIPDQGLWWGTVVFPSRDHVGRRYPFAVFTGIPAQQFGSEVGLVAMAFVPFFQRVLAAQAKGWPGSVEDLRAMLAGLAWTPDMVADEKRLVASLEDFTSRELWSALLGSFVDPRKDGIVAGLLATASGSANAAGLRIQPMVHQGHFCFWLMLLWLLRDRAGMPALITLMPESAGMPPSATVLWDRPSLATVFAALWPASTPPGTATGISDLLAMSGKPLPELEEPMSDGDLPLRDLLHAIVSAARRQRTLDRTTALRRTGNL